MRLAARLRPLLLCAALALSACGGGNAPFARLSGISFHNELREISGMAASHRHDGVLWVHNDGGHAPALYALSPRGRLLARLDVEGVTNTDWEDMASFRQDGRDFLLIADTGDNGGLRKTLQLHVLEEPAELADAALHPLRTITFRWPDGPRDCEAVAVDVQRQQILLISKKQLPPQLYALPLQAEPGQVHVARALGELHAVPPADAQTPLRRRRQFASQVTAADVAPDGSQLAVLTYQDALFYARAPDEDWGQAVARAPQSLRLPWLLPQPEALAYSAGGGGLFASGEFSPAMLLWLRPPAPEQDDGESEDAAGDARDEEPAP